MVSRGTESFLADSTAANNRALLAGSGTPSLAATWISFTALLTICPRLSAYCSRPFCFHCAPMREGLNSDAESSTSTETGAICCWVHLDTATVVASGVPSRWARCAKLAGDSQRYNAHPFSDGGSVQMPPFAVSGLTNGQRKGTHTTRLFICFTPFLSLFCEKSPASPGSPVYSPCLQLACTPLI